MTPLVSLGCVLCDAEGRAHPQGRGCASDNSVPEGTLVDAYPLAAAVREPRGRARLLGGAFHASAPRMGHSLATPVARVASHSTQRRGTEGDHLSLGAGVTSARGVTARALAPRRFAPVREARTRGGRRAVAAERPRRGPARSADAPGGLTFFFA